MGHIQQDFVHAASPVARFLGHSLAVALGFCGLAVISLIPIGVIKLLIRLGVDQLAGTLHGLETLLLVVDIGLFGIVFLSGAAVFLAETLATSLEQIKSAWRKHE